MAKNIPIKYIKITGSVFVKKKILSSELCTCPLDKMDPVQPLNRKHTGKLMLDRKCGGVMTVSKYDRYKFNKDSMYRLWFNKGALHG